MSCSGLLPCKLTCETPFRLSQIAAVITALSAQVLNPRAKCGDAISSKELLVRQSRGRLQRARSRPNAYGE
jgi:hypothetical protein